MSAARERENALAHALARKGIRVHMHAHTCLHIMQACELEVCTREQLCVFTMLRTGRVQRSARFAIKGLWFMHGHSKCARVAATRLGGIPGISKRARFAATRLRLMHVNS